MELEEEEEEEEEERSFLVRIVRRYWQLEKQAEDRKQMENSLPHKHTLYEGGGVSHGNYQYWNYFVPHI